ncbi:MAG: 3-isopropylmalate dehydratase small subunit [Odoribacteraceae bacterium]|jgi:3-isopropylmalate/(R)-2-methylmalate dehydratase small subunit|nr:3-isopropylmalate dehydratase small subunit [Odoribacteraceae bacterium]
MTEPFTTLTATVFPLPVENIDTDRVIPARFLKTTTRDGLGKYLFTDWLPAGLPPDRGAVLAAGANFGCGSSREHAAWAIRDAGFRAVISSRFADIFRVNALNNGLLPVQVSPRFLARLFDLLDQRPDAPVTIDLAARVVRFEGEEELFDIPAYKQQCLLKGLDDIDYLLSIRQQIEHH